MQRHCFSTAGHSTALTYTIKELEAANWVQEKDASVVILPVPSFDGNGNIKGGGSIQDIPTDRLIVGGNLNHPALKKHKCLDLLKDPFYLSENAAITAYCAISIIAENLPVVLQGCPLLVAGWGRIGKCLARLLRLLGAQVTVAARSATDRALLEALGYPVLNIQEESLDLGSYRGIINTIPAPVFSPAMLATCRPGCLKIDLASEKGIDDPAVIWARGLPNLDAPESSGKLMAKIIRRELET